MNLRSLLLAAALPLLALVSTSAVAQSRTVLFEENFSANNGWGRHKWYGGLYAEAGSVPKPSRENILPATLLNAAGGGRPPRALMLRADFSQAAGAHWGAWLNLVQPVAVKNTQRDLSKLRLSFTASGSRAGGFVFVQVLSHDAPENRRASGMIEARVALDAANSAQSFELPLSQFVAKEGEFDPAAPAVSLKFEIRRDWGKDPAATLQITDIVYEAVP
jgi:hypothetical protein